MNNPLKIAYVEDHKVVKEGVNYSLSQYPFLKIIEEDFAADRMDDFIASHQPDIFLMDLIFHTEERQLNGFEMCGLIHSKYPDIKLVAHSMYDDVESANKFFRQGGIGFVSKKAGHVELINAIKQVAEGKRYLCKEMIKKCKNAGRFLKNEDQQLKAVNETFTRAEKSILEKIAKGYSTKQIAQQLEISEKTVETHRKHLFVKAKVKNVAELIAFAYSRRIFIE